MKNKKTRGGLWKRTAAAALSLVMVFGMAAVLPENIAERTMTTACAFNTNDGGHTFYYEKIGGKKVRINDVSLGDKVITVPSTITIDDEEYTVTEIGDNFAENCSIFAMTIPDTVTKIGDDFARNTPMDSLYLPDSLEYIGDRFCYNVPSLKNVEFNGTKLTHLGSQPFMGDKLTSYHYRYRNNRKGAVLFGDWVLAYYGSETDIVVSELSDDVAVKHIASEAFTPPGALYYDPKKVKTVDLEGVTYIADGAFKGCVNIEEVKNGDSVEYVGPYALHYTKWFNDKKGEGKCVLGKSLLWYRSNDETVDLTSQEFDSIKQVNKYALQGCTNAEGIKVRPNLDVSEVILPKTVENSKYVEELGALSELYINGDKITFDAKSPFNDSLADYTQILTGTQLEADLIREKTKSVLSSIGVRYYGLTSNTAEMTAQEAYTAAKKIHDYICENYTFGCESKNMLDGYIVGKRMDSEKFASLYSYMLRCAGIESLVVKRTAGGGLDSSPAYDHSWVLVKLEDDWYHSDVCWDSASQGNTMKYFLLSDSAVKELGQHESWELSNPMGLEALDVSDMPECSVLHGDTNGDGVLSYDDLEGYIAILNTKKQKASKASDVDLDGDTDIDDMYLLDDILSENPFTPTNKDSKPENELMAKNARVFEEYKPDSVGQVKVIIASDTQVFSKEVLLSELYGRFVLPEFDYKTPSYEKFDKWELGKPGDEVYLTKPVTILHPVWVDDSKPVTSKTGDVNQDGAVDIVDAVTVISHINGTHAMSNKSMKIADVNRYTKVDIEDAVLIIGYVNGSNTL